MQKITHRRCSYFAFGDYNSKNRFWNCSRANTSGNILYQELNNNNFIILHPPDPTHYPENPVIAPSTIDLILTNGLHNTTLIIVPSKLTFSWAELSSATIQTWSLTLDWEKYRSIIISKINMENHNLSDITNKSQIDTMVQHLTMAMEEAQHRSIPLIHPEPFSLQLSPEIIGLIKERNQIKRIWQRRRCSILKASINRLNKEIARKINELKNINWNHKISSIPKSDVKLWQVTKILKLKHKQIPPIISEEKTLYNPEDKANLLADTFKKNHENPLENTCPNFTSRIANYVSQKLQCDLSSPPPCYPSVEDVALEIKCLKVSKAPGLDKIHNSLVKQLPWNGVKFLHLIIMASIKLCYFPEKWKIANVIPIHKPGKSPQLPTSYRPISLLSSLSKILERIVLKRINDHIASNNIIPPEQHGFRKQKSTTHQLDRIITHIRTGFKTNTKSTAMIILDVEKAFDRVWHNGLIYKLLSYNFPKDLVKFIKSYLTSRKFQVTIKKKEVNS